MVSFLSVKEGLFALYQTGDFQNLPVTGGLIWKNVLGRLSFLIKVNDIVHILCNRDSLMFADDTEIVFEFPSAILENDNLNI